MINISEVTKLEDEALEKRVAEEKRKQQAYNQQLDETRKENIREAEQGKLAAEEHFPAVLKRVEEDIRTSIRHKSRSVTVYCSAGSEWERMYTQIMLVQILPLQGFICKIADVRVDISW
jgi:hypothetical protein